MTTVDVRGRVYEDAPASASERGYLSIGLPWVYKETDPGGKPPLVLRWLHGLEQVVDPTVTIIDNLASYFDAQLAPAPMVRTLLLWLGLRPAADRPIDAARAVLAEVQPAKASVRGVPESLGRARGTCEGLQRLLHLAFPELQLEVRQNATFTVGDDPYERPDAPAPVLVEVHCLTELEPGSAIAACNLIAYARPVLVPITLVTPTRRFDVP